MCVRTSCWSTGVHATGAGDKHPPSGALVKRLWSSICGQQTPCNNQHGGHAAATCYPPAGRQLLAQGLVWCQAPCLLVVYKCRARTPSWSALGARPPPTCANIMCTQNSRSSLGSCRGCGTCVNVGSRREADAVSHAKHTCVCASAAALGCMQERTPAWTQSCPPQAPGAHHVSVTVTTTDWLGSWQTLLRSVVRITRRQQRGKACKLWA